MSAVDWSLAYALAGIVYTFFAVPSDLRDPTFNGVLHLPAIQRFRAAVIPLFAVSMVAFWPLFMVIWSIECAKWWRLWHDYDPTAIPVPTFDDEAEPLPVCECAAPVVCEMHGRHRDNDGIGCGVCHTCDKYVKTGAAGVRMLAVILAALLLSGCVDSSTRSTRDTVERDTYRISGAFQVPVAAADPALPAVMTPVPFDVTVTHEGTAKAEATSDTHTQLDLSALTGAIAAGVRQAVPALGALGGFGGRAAGGGMDTDKIIGAILLAVNSLASALAVHRSGTVSRKIDENRRRGYPPPTGSTPPIAPEVRPT